MAADVNGHICRRGCDGRWIRAQSQEADHNSGVLQREASPAVTKRGTADTANYGDADTAAGGTLRPKAAAPASDEEEIITDASSSHKCLMGRARLQHQSSHPKKNEQQGASNAPSK